MKHGELFHRCCGRERSSTSRHAVEDVEVDKGWKPSENILVYKIILCFAKTFQALRGCNPFSGPIRHQVLD